MTQNLAPLSAGDIGHRRTGQALSSSALVLSWLYLNLPTLQWFGESLTGLSTFNALFLAGAILLLSIQTFRYRQQIQLAIAPVFDRIPLALLGGSAVAAIGIRWWIEFEQIPAVLFLLGSYGLAGLFLQPFLWRQGLPAAITLSVILPFWLQFTTGLGFPARILTAQAVEALLHTWHITALSSEDIIVLDTGIAQVDLPCSGLKSLWMGTVLLLGMTWLEGRRIGLRWLLVCTANLGLLIGANVARVLTLVLLIYALHQPALAEVVHVPLGVISFMTVALMSWSLLRWVPQNRAGGKVKSEPAPPLGKSTPKGAGIWMGALVIGLVALSAVPRPDTSVVLPTFANLGWSAPMQAESIPLAAHEQDFFAAHAGAVAEKQRFNFEGITGSMILVNSPTWQAHHSPELCYVSGGFQVGHMSQQQLTPTVLGRWLSLNHGSSSNQPTYSAAYWFQSPDRTTDSFIDRFWADLTRQERSWVMVSILFDQVNSPDTPAMQALLNTVQAEVDRVQG